MSEPEIGAGRVRHDDLRSFGLRILDALHIPGKQVTRLSLVVEGPHFLPVVTVERAVIQRDELEALRSVCEQYKLAPAEGEAVVPKASAGSAF